MNGGGSEETRPSKITRGARPAPIFREDEDRRGSGTPDRTARISIRFQEFRALREAVDAEISELAADLATTDDAHLFGDNEFKIRALAHKIAAKALEQHLAQKKTATKAPA